MPINLKNAVNSLREELQILKTKYGIVGLKGGTEIEDLDYDEIELIHNICLDIVPLTIKIGGPEARNDMRNLFKIKVEGILAPMIESAYGFKNYIKTALDLLKEYGTRPLLCLNAETISFYDNMQKIISDPYFERIDAVTVGRGDLSGSMEAKSVDEPEVTKVAAEIVSTMKQLGKITSVGGSVMPANITNIRDKIKSHRANTRHVVISLEHQGDLKESCAMALGFEMHLYKILMEFKPEKAKAYKNRIDVTKNRIKKGFAKAVMIA